MRVIGVLDLRRGIAVHARAGDRATYAPARSRVAQREGDALAIARGYRRTLAVDELYIADLDAILGEPPQRRLVAALAQETETLWLDAAVATPDGAYAALTVGAARVVVALETLPSLAALEAVTRAIGGERVAFSLDLRDGRPLACPPALSRMTAPDLAAAAAAAGARTVVVLDVARVGTDRGPDWALLAQVRRAASASRLIAGGGVRGANDLHRLAAAGCDGALVASALHDGRIGAPVVRAARADWRRAT